MSFLFRVSLILDGGGGAQNITKAKGGNHIYITQFFILCKEGDTHTHHMRVLDSRWMKMGDDTRRSTSA